MTSREAMQALLDGKRLRRKDVNDSEYIHLVDDELVWNGGYAATLIDGEHYEIYEERNPHPKGTFNWAREEARRGRAVSRPHWTNKQMHFSPDVRFQVKDLDATDWEVVP